MSKQAWVVRAGIDGVLLQKLEARGIVAAGWAAMGDCCRLVTRDDFRRRGQQVYPNDPQYARQYGQVYRFVRVIEIGDTVLTPDSERREVLVGKVASVCRHDPEAADIRYPHVRDVTWLDRIRRDDMSPQLAGSTGSQLSIFSLAGHEDEIRRMLGEHVPRHNEECSAKDDGYIPVQGAPREDGVAQLKAEIAEMEAKLAALRKKTR